MQFAEQVREFYVVHCNDDNRRADHDYNDDSFHGDYDHDRTNDYHYNAAGLPVQLHHGIGVFRVKRLVQERLFLQLWMLLPDRSDDYYG